MHHDISQMNLPNLCRLGQDSMGMVCRKGCFISAYPDFDAVKNFRLRSSLYYSDHSSSIRVHCRKIFQELELIIKDTQVAESNVTKLITPLQDGAFLMPYCLSKKELIDDLLFIEFPGVAENLGVYAVWNNSEKENLIHYFAELLRKQAEKRKPPNRISHIASSCRGAYHFLLTCAQPLLQTHDLNK